MFSVMTSSNNGEYIISYSIRCANGKKYYFNDFVSSKYFSVVLCVFLMQFRNIDFLNDLTDITIKIKSPGRILCDLRGDANFYVVK